MMERNADVIVIGSGPGGEGAAMQLAKSGKSVIVIEKYDRVGGGCTHWGTIPSKALRTAIFQATEALNHPLIASAGPRARPTVSDMGQRARGIIDSQVEMRRKFYSRNGVKVISGHARFIDANTIEVSESEKLTADHFVIAVGSRPYRPESVDFSHPRIFDSDTILRMTEHPQSMTVYGAGVIGCEYSSMFRNMDVKINLVNSRDELLDFLDDEISDALGYHLRSRGVVIRHNEHHDRIEGCDDGVITHLKSGKKLKTDILLWAVGRTGNTDSLGVDNIGLTPDSRGYLEVDGCFRTQVDNIYAVGDVIGFPSLASAAYTQGRAAANRILDSDEGCAVPGDIPSGIYTSPEISCIGRTEKELTEARVPYEVGIAHFKDLARAQIIGRQVGMLKILFNRDTLELLGVHCFGVNAAEIIHIGQAVMMQPGEQNSLRYFMNTTFNYPTMAEAYRVAALNGFNRLF
ncbi:MAG: Si-specific NAD(P)(+) transhydrogenase [Planctomycetota bacterium]